MFNERTFVVHYAKSFNPLKLKENIAISNSHLLQMLLKAEIS